MYQREYSPTLRQFPDQQRPLALSGAAPAGLQPWARYPALYPLFPGNAAERGQQIRLDAHRVAGESEEAAQGLAE